MTLEDELPRLVGAQYATGEEWTNNSRNNERLSQSENNTQLCMWLVMEVKPETEKNKMHRNME